MLGTNVVMARTQPVKLRIPSLDTSFTLGELCHIDFAPSVLMSFCAAQYWCTILLLADLGGYW